MLYHFPQLFSFCKWWGWLLWVFQRTHMRASPEQVKVLEKGFTLYKIHFAFFKILGLRDHGNSRCKKLPRYPSGFPLSKPMVSPLSAWPQAICHVASYVMVLILHIFWLVFLCTPLLFLLFKNLYLAKVIVRGRDYTFDVRLYIGKDYPFYTQGEVCLRRAYKLTINWEIFHLVYLWKRTLTWQGA